MIDDDHIAFLVEGERITEVEIQHGSAVGHMLCVRRLGEDGPYRRVYSDQVHDTYEDAKADVEAYRGLPRVHGKSLDGFRKRGIL